mmetsp:Transcript_21376/g.63851  ORF Transcript_21376/g.63851 Transcript_21376/m.63851 type:complete len:83 (-) Transcript_21376:168-416(-)
MDVCHIVLQSLHESPCHKIHVQRRGRTDVTQDFKNPRLRCLVHALQRLLESLRHKWFMFPVVQHPTSLKDSPKNIRHARMLM